MLTDLVQTIETLQQRIRSRGTFIGDYESRTRVALIDPMLRALGWDVSDPGLVHIEPRTANGWADYALLGGDERPVVFVEAKKLADRDAPIQQTVGYAVTENIQHRSNVRYCASTNGDRWEVYDIIAQEPVISVSLSGEKAPKCALKLLGLWRDSLMDGRLDFPIEPVVSAELETIPPAPQQPVTVAQRIVPPTPSVEIASVPLAPSTAGWTPLTDNFKAKGKASPNAMRLPDGSERPVTAWKGVSLNSALWLHEKGILTRENCQFSLNGKRYLFSPDAQNPAHPDGSPFSDLKPVGETGIVMEATTSANAAVRRTRELMSHFRQDPSQVYLRLPG